jgi:dCMP deaminase
MKVKYFKSLDVGTDFYNYTPPSWDVWFMKQVYLVAEKSKDPSTKIGAILVKDNHIISSGYNGFPRKVRDRKGRYLKREIKYKFVVHAEDNAVLAAARFGISTLDTVLYTQGIPCCECAKSVIQGGIKTIVVHKQWQLRESSRWDKSCEISSIMFKEAGIPIIVLDAVLNVDGYTNGKRFRV